MQNEEELVSLKWLTHQADMMIAYMARVSNPNAKEDDPADKLINYLIQHRHWSPFEMASMCVEIYTTRDIGRQILRHRSFSFQEFSQRYSKVETVAPMRAMRKKGTTNRQGSLLESNPELEMLAWNAAQSAYRTYCQLMDAGVAPECARAVLPEGFTMTRMYMTGTIRSWIHYLEQRCDEHAQREHQYIARWIRDIFVSYLPMTAMAAGFVK